MLTAELADDLCEALTEPEYKAALSALDRYYAEYNLSLTKLIKTKNYQAVGAPIYNLHCNHLKLLFSDWTWHTQ